MEQYETILQRMQERFEQEAGQPVTQVTDADLRLRVLAGEVYRLQAELAWLKAQVFPFSAQGEWLDRHGELRGVARKAAEHAQGTLTFTRYLPLSFDVIIPKGTVCAVSGDDPTEFETTEDVTLPAESLTVTAPAQAVSAGVSGNVAAGQVNTLVTESDVIEYVTNTAAFTGGTAAESDEIYRTRILRSYREPTTALNTAWYAECAKSIEGITMAQAVAEGSTVTVYCWGAGTAPTASALTAAQEELETRRDVGVTVAVQAAEGTAYTLKMRLRMTDGADFTTAAADATAAAETYFAGLSIGDGVSTDAISRLILRDAAVASVEFPTSVRDLTATAGVLPVLSTVSVEEIT